MGSDQNSRRDSRVPRFTCIGPDTPLDNWYSPPHPWNSRPDTCNAHSISACRARWIYGCAAISSIVGCGSVEGATGERLLRN